MTETLNKLYFVILDCLLFTKVVVNNELCHHEGQADSGTGFESNTSDFITRTRHHTTATHSLTFGSSRFSHEGLIDSASSLLEHHLEGHLPWLKNSIEVGDVWHGSLS